jgi:predicted porin
MKKSLIALAVAGALTAPMVAQADATLYGSMRLALSSFDNTDLDLHDNSSRVGIKGDVDLGLEDTKGLFQWEFNINTADSDQYGNLGGERIGIVGAKGSWGTVLAGKQYHPHFLVMNANTYLFNDAGMGEGLFIGNAHKRVDNTVAYASPSMNGVTVVAGVVTQGQTDAAPNETIDGWNVAAKYSGAGLNVAVSVAKLAEDGALTAANVEQDVWGISAKYAVTDALTLMARYEDKEVDTAGVTADSDVVWLGGQFKTGNTALKLAWGQLDDGSAEDGDFIGVEVEQVMGKGRIYAAYADYSDLTRTTAGTAAVDTTAAGNNDQLTIGYRLDF